MWHPCNSAMTGRTGECLCRAEWWTRGKYGAAPGSCTLAILGSFNEQWVIIWSTKCTFSSCWKEIHIPYNWGWEYPCFISRRSLSSAQTSLFSLWGFSNKLYYETGNKTIGRFYFESGREGRNSIAFPLEDISPAFPLCPLLCKTHSPVRNSNLWAWQGHNGDQAAHLHILITINIYFFPFVLWCSPFIF